MTQDELIIQQFDTFLDTGEYHFFSNLPVVIRLQEIGLIGDLPEPNENIKQIALGKIITSKIITDFDKMAVKESNLKHKLLTTRAHQINEMLAVKKVFQKLKDEGKHIYKYLNK